MDFFVWLLMVVIVGLALYQFVIKPARRRQSRKRRLEQQVRQREAEREAEKLRRDAEEAERIKARRIPAYPFGGKKPFRRDPVTEQLKGKMPLRPVSDTPDTSPTRRPADVNSNNPLNPGILFIDDSIYEGFEPRPDDSHTDDRSAPSPEPSHTVDSPTPAPASQDWGGSPSGGDTGGGYSGGGDTSGGFSGGDSGSF